MLDVWGLGPLGGDAFGVGEPEEQVVGGRAVRQTGSWGVGGGGKGVEVVNEGDK